MYGIATDTSGNLYLADAWMSQVRLINKQTGIITTVAGVASTQGSTGDFGPATSALLSPMGVSVDPINNLLYIADSGNNKIRLVTLSSGIIITYAGTGVYGHGGDGGAATNAQLWGPTCTAIDPFGNVYIADTSNDRIRKVNSAGIISTFAGDGTQSFPGDGLQATAASIAWPAGVATDRFGNVYVADTVHNRIR